MLRGRDPSAAAELGFPLLVSQGQIRSRASCYVPTLSRWTNSGCNLGAVSRLQRRANAVDRQHAQHLPDCDAWFAAFNSGDRLDVNTQSSGCRRLAITGVGTSQSGGSSHVFDCAKGVDINVCRDALALSHPKIAAQSNRVSNFGRPHALLALPPRMRGRRVLRRDRAGRRAAVLSNTSSERAPDSRARPPLLVLAAREYATKGDALRAERSLKALPRERTFLLRRRGLVRLWGCDIPYHAASRARRLLGRTPRAWIERTSM